jgi:hypothetical protein
MKMTLKWFVSLALMAVAPGMIATAEAAPGKQATTAPLQLAAIQTHKQDLFNMHAAGCGCPACQQAHQVLDRSTV